MTRRFALELIIPGLAAIAGVPWVLLQAFENISNWDLSQRKLRAEVEDLESRNEQRRIEIEKARNGTRQSRAEISLDLNFRTGPTSRGRAEREDARRTEAAIVRRLEQDELPAIDAEFVELSELDADRLQ